MYKYFTKNNTYRYLDVINKFLTGYNSVHPAIGMPLSKVNHSNIYPVCRKVNSRGLTFLMAVLILKLETLLE